jgi:hypothetical protein
MVVKNLKETVKMKHVTKTSCYKARDKMDIMRSLSLLVEHRASFQRFLGLEVCIL